MNLEKTVAVAFLILMGFGVVYLFPSPDPIQFTYCKEYNSYTSYQNKNLIVKLKPLSKEEINQMKLETWRANLVLINNGDVPLKVELRGHSKFGTSSEFITLEPNKETVMDYIPVAYSYYYEGSLIDRHLDCVTREDFPDFWLALEE